MATMTGGTSDQSKDMSDGDLEYELENIPVTESCDVIRYADLFFVSFVSIFGFVASRVYYAVLLWS
jgi:hypothetical protein